MVQIVQDVHTGISWTTLFIVHRYHRSGSRFNPPSVEFVDSRGTDNDEQVKWFCVIRQLQTGVTRIISSKGKDLICFSC